MKVIVCPKTAGVKIATGPCAEYNSDDEEGEIQNPENARFEANQGFVQKSSSSHKV